jgi:myo-inositol-1(or 4)-monophosphatase
VLSEAIPHRVPGHCNGVCRGHSRLGTSDAPVWSDGGVNQARSAPSTPPAPIPDPAADTPAELRRVAEQVALEAAEHLRALPRPWDSGADPAAAGAAVSTKSSPTDVVTASDQALETLIRARLAQLRPGEPVVGEEQGGADGGTAGIRWVVDPIDGTVNFLYGLPWYAISVAATRDGRSVAGAVVEPDSGRVWTAAAGGGATCDGRPLRVSAATDVALSLLATGFAYSAERRSRQAGLIGGLLPRVRDIRRGGSAALELCAVAAGWTDAYLEHGTNWWDWAAGALIATEAGAVVRVPGPTGSVPPDDGLGADALLAASPAIAAELADLARAHGAASV